MSQDMDFCQQYTPWRSTSADAEERTPKAVCFERNNGPGRMIETRCYAEQLECRYFVGCEPPAVPGPDLQTLLDVLDGLTEPGADAAALAARLTPAAAPGDARQR